MELEHRASPTDLALSDEANIKQPSGETEGLVWSRQSRKERVERHEMLIGRMTAEKAWGTLIALDTLTLGARKGAVHRSSLHIGNECEPNRPGENLIEDMESPNCRTPLTNEVFISKKRNRERTTRNVIELDETLAHIEPRLKEHLYCITEALCVYSRRPILWI